MKNIDLLRESDCIAVVSGQQAGLFTGPLYTIYKALSAVKLAGCLRQRNTKAVPVFWIAAEDHDFAEVAKAEFIGRDCQLKSVEVSTDLHREGQPVGHVKLDDSIDAVVDELFELLPHSEFAADMKALVKNAWQPGRGYADSFATMMTSLLGRYGLIFLDPLDPELKRSLRRSIPKPRVARLRSPPRSNSEALSWSAPDITRRCSRPRIRFRCFCTMKKAGDTLSCVLQMESTERKISTQEYTAEELAALAQEQPERFSPNVTLRAVVQDYLLPTIAYYGGAAEIAYFAQTAEVYRVLERPATPILPRSSLTMIERHTGRVLERYNLTLADFVEGLDPVIKRVVEEHLAADTAKLFADAEQNMNHELDRLRQELQSIDPTLASALDTGRKKINYQLDGLKQRFVRAQMTRDEAAHRQLQRAFDQLYPNKDLQERHINITSLLARHGTYVIEWIFNAINLGSNEHQIVYL